MSWRWALVPVTMELLVSAATSYHHSTLAKWEVGAAYFGSIGVYVESRLFHWLVVAVPVAGVAVAVFREARRMRRVVGVLAVSFVLDLVATLGSANAGMEPSASRIYFSSAAAYLSARLMFWIPGFALVLWRARCWFTPPD